MEVSRNYYWTTQVVPFEPGGVVDLVNLLSTVHVPVRAT